MMYILHTHLSYHLYFFFSVNIFLCIPPGGFR